MSLLFKNLRVHQVFGANTDVGKTLLTSALVRASAALKNEVFYLKPVSTGPMSDADDEHVKRFAGAYKDAVRTRCLFRYDDPVSPHLAAQMSADRKGEKTAIFPTDSTFVTSVANHIRQCASESRKSAHMYVETAGGVHSPTLSGTTQLDAYRPLRLPCILVGDSKLGGISSTIASFEALALRGYTVDAILLFKDSYYKNYEYLTPYFAERGIRVDSFSTPPPRHEDIDANFKVTEAFYAEMVLEDTKEGGIYDLVKHLDAYHEKRLDELASMPQRTLDTVWWPFVQHGLNNEPQNVNVIDSAWGDYFTVFNGHHTPRPTSSHSVLEPQFDGSASWWTQALGHGHPALALAAARAAGRYGHVMFPQATHAPALRLSERLVRDGPGQGWAARAFLSDDGSTGMEIALKMALRTFAASRPERPREWMKELGVLGLKGSYHGDTIGAMDACEDTGVYTCEWHHARGFWFDPPTVGIRKGRTVVALPGAMGGDEASTGSLVQTYDIQSRLDTPLAALYREHIERTLHKLSDARLATLVLEPLVMGAGGMIFVDPLFQRVLVDVARKLLEVPVIFDEVFVGLHRLGLKTTSEVLGVYPDISVHAKILTGGLVPLAATLANSKVFKAFWSREKKDALLHGHSYSAHAVGCEVANETLDILERMERAGQWDEAKAAWAANEQSGTVIWSLWAPSFVDMLSRTPGVKEAMTMGTVLAINLEDHEAGYESHSAQMVLSSLAQAVGSIESGTSAAPGGGPFSVHFRTLGNVAYFMTSLNTPDATIREVEDRIWAALNSKTLN
ncbi:pyridoxal phosphate-dependent transferase [Vararia minispora EC-137]|uniref:Pyridoxal phosphate-dependent transferase n=1 Tax=Vararia minispora EC-137 TaxID=1314806 RepID=A0ACB8QN53_9AGAM|nr:pyridoxal phosphate-dependent transferase [Vararia minispora EC-137]